MGQYFRAFLRNKTIDRIVVSPSEFSTGLKLMEHAYLGEDFTQNVCFIIEALGATKVAWVGDYADEYPQYKQVWSADDHIQKAVTDYNYKDKLLFNHTKKVYIDFNEYIEENGSVQDDFNTRFIVHPLCLLTAVGNGRGGGDYHGMNEELVGTWCDDEISIGYFEDLYTFKDFTKYQKIKVKFYEI